MWRFDCYLIIPHPTEPRVLVLPDAAGWGLPHLSLEAPRSQGELHLLRHAAGEQFGADVIPLRRIYMRVDDEGNHADVVYVLEHHSPDAVMPAGKWVGREHMADLALACPEQRTAVLEWLAEAEGAPEPNRRAPWARRGWFTEAAAWIERQLSQRGYPLEAPVEQFRSASISCVLRARTTRGDIYFKVAAALPLFGDEPALTRALAERFPDSMPTILAIEPAARWMLMPDFGSVLSKTRDAAVWAEALHRFGQIQVACAASTDDLFEAGCLDRRLDRLPTQVRALLQDDVSLAELHETEADRLCALMPRIADMCERLASYAVPQTLVHGDLHLGNIASDGARYIFFDWTDGCVAHPFFDLVTMLNHADEMLGSLEGHQTLLRDTYLAVWGAYEPSERLREACALALPLGALHQAVSYQHILAGVEGSARVEWQGATGYWLRKMLAFMPEATN